MSPLTVLHEGDQRGGARRAADQLQPARHRPGPRHARRERPRRRRLHLHVPDHHHRRTAPVAVAYDPAKLWRDPRGLDPGDAPDRPGLPSQRQHVLRGQPGPTTTSRAAPARRSRARWSPQANCDNCHARFKAETTTSAAAFHGGGRVDAAYVQRLPQPRLAPRNPLADSAGFVHRIHHGEEVADGQPLPRHRGDLPAGHPQLRHLPRGRGAGRARRHRPVRPWPACGSATTTSTSPARRAAACTNPGNLALGTDGMPVPCNHVGGPQADDSGCATCHGPAQLRIERQAPARSPRPTRTTPGWSAAATTTPTPRTSPRPAIVPDGRRGHHLRRQERRRGRSTRPSRPNSSARRSPSSSSETARTWCSRPTRPARHHRADAELRRLAERLLRLRRAAGRHQRRRPTSTPPPAATSRRSGTAPRPAPARAR